MTKNLLFSFLFFFIIFISNCSDKNNLKKYNDILNSGKFSGLSATEKQKLIKTAITLKNYNNFALLIESTALNDLINLETKILKDVFIALIDLNELDALIKILDETKILDNQNFKIIYAELLIKTCEFTKLDLFLRGSSKHFQSADLQYLQKKYIQHFYSAEKHDNLLRCADILSHYVNLEIDEFLLVIDALINLNKYESAKYYCKRGLTAFKNNIKKEQIYYYYAKILAKEGDYSAAANYLDNLKSREFANSRNFILTLIEVYSNLPDKKDLLISEYNRLLNFELPKNIRLEILIKLMNYFENIKQYNLALKFANEITAIDKHNIQAHTIIIKYSEKPQRLIDSAQALLK
ncbi:MAG TPA: hypothetical protein PLJ38_08165, partial [bacterium]|nr:hypothetical protein [bacterium]